VKDTKNQDGTVKEVATAKMVTANKGKSRLGASVSIKFSQEFASQVSWQKTDEGTGAVVEDEDITDGGDTGGENGVVIVALAATETAATTILPENSKGKSR